ncbi:actin-like ATPase domain-containing protein [Gigaspora margarita]|nr:actin-like ATPase domain-containing protein [Gigaspora margarita]
MVLQYANNSDLRCYLSNHFLELNWTTKIRMAKEIASGVNCLHNANIVHRDLHDKNILVHDDRLMITDFGLSKSLENSTKSIVGGTCAYSDPQYLQNPFLYKRGKPSDIYSLGVLFWELSSGVPPFKNIKEQTGISFRVIAGQRESPVNGTPMDFLNLYNNAWDGNPDLRPSIAKICDKLNNIAMDQIYYGEEIINEHYMVQSEHNTFLSGQDIILNDHDTIPSKLDIVSSEQDIIPNDQYTIPSNLDIVSSEQDIIPNYQDTIPSNLDIVLSEQDMVLHEQGVILSDQDIVLNEQEHDTLKLDILCVVALDIGASFSGQQKNKIISNFNRQEQAGVFKTNSVLAYDDNLQVVAWGCPALVKGSPNKKEASSKPSRKPVELFMLYLTDIEEADKPYLSPGLDAEKVITDYLHEMKKLILETLSSRWPDIMYPQQVLFVLPVPAEWSHKAKATMKKCMYNAGYLDDRQSEKLKFITESEAAAIYCMRILNEHRLSVGSSFLIVNCGGSTVNITTRTILLPDKKLGEITERSSILCGSSYVNREFLKFLGRKLGFAAMKKLKEYHNGQMQYLIQQFCSRVKFSFNGNPNEYTPKELDIERICPALIQYVTGQVKEQMEESEWLIELDFQTVKEMFDPVVKKIIEIIQKHCASTERRCAAMSLVGGFSESQYLQDQIRRHFATQIPIIAVPQHPIAAIERGALVYGLNSLKKVFLKYCHGIEVIEKWEKNDPPERRTSLGQISRFKRLAPRGVEVCAGQKFHYIHTVDSNQAEMMVNIVITPDNNARYCDEYGMVMVGKMKIDLSDSQKKKKFKLTLKKQVVKVEIILTFGAEKVMVTAINKKTGQFYKDFCYCAF